jgi:hypothetical protein
VEIGVVNNVNSTNQWANAVKTSQQFVKNASIYILTETFVATGCSNSDTIFVGVNAPPIAFAGNDTSISSGKTVSFGNNPVSGYKYYWSTGDTSSTITKIIISKSTYSLTVFDANGCSDTDEVNINIITGLEKLNQNNSNNQLNNIRLYPNPSQNAQFNLLGADKGGQILIYDMQGKVLYQNVLLSAENQLIQTAVAKGMYLVEVRTVEGVKQVKWVVE